MVQCPCNQLPAEDGSPPLHVHRVTAALARLRPKSRTDTLAQGVQTGCPCHDANDRQANLPQVISAHSYFVFFRWDGYHARERRLSRGRHHAKHRTREKEQEQEDGDQDDNHETCSLHGRRSVRSPVSRNPHSDATRVRRVSYDHDPPCHSRGSFPASMTATSAMQVRKYQKGNTVQVGGLWVSGPSLQVGPTLH